MENIENKDGFQEKLNFIKSLVSRFYNSKKLNGLLIRGEPGIGKTYTVRQVLNDIQSKDPSMSFTIVKGKTTPRGLYDIIYNYQYPNSIIVFDDTDDVLYDTVSMNVIKAATDTGVNRIVSWESSRNGSTIRFNGKIIILTNVNFRDNPHFRAVLDRFYCYELDITPEEKFERLKYVLEEQKKVDFVKENDPEYQYYKLVEQLINDTDFKEKVLNRHFSLRLIQTSLGLAEFCFDYEELKNNVLETLELRTTTSK